MNEEKRYPYWVKKGSEQLMDYFIEKLFYEPEDVKQKIQDSVRKSIENGEDHFIIPENMSIINHFDEWYGDILLIYGRIIHQQLTFPDLVEKHDSYTDAVVDHIQGLLWETEFNEVWTEYFGEEECGKEVIS